jgi:hypothetical protein
VSKQKFALSPSVSSPQDLSALILEIKEYSKWFRHNEIKHKTNAKSASPPPVLSDGALETLRTLRNKNLIKGKDLEELIKTLGRFQAKAPLMTITLAAPAPKALKKNLVDWTRQNLAPDVLITFQFNSTLLGGMVIKCGSHVFDLSLRRKLLNSGNKFPEILRNV